MGKNQKETANDFDGGKGLRGVRHKQQSQS